MEKGNIPDVGTSSRIFLVGESMMNYFYVQMRQHLAFSIARDGFWSFIKDFVRTFIPKNQHKALSRGKDR